MECFNQLEIEATELNTPNPSRLFDCSVEKRIECTECCQHSVSQELYRGWSLDSQNKSVATLLQEFFEPEILEYSCSKCQGTKAKLTQKLEGNPSILVIHLKRFAMDLPTRKITKSSSCLELSMQLDLNDIPLVDNSLSSTSYELQAVVSHLGSSMEYGHYTCDVRSENGIWCTYDDSLVFDLGGDAKLQSARKTDAYILFYIPKEPALDPPIFT
jgi:ubiquitin C-terminal hydrolase